MAQERGDPVGSLIGKRFWIGKQVWIGMQVWIGKWHPHLLLERNMPSYIR